MPVYKLRKGTPQYDFAQSRAKIQFMGGGFGNGKTTALAIKFLRICEEYPGANVLLGRSTYPRLNDTLRKEFLRWCPPDWIRRMPTKDENTLYMHNGSVVNFRYIQQKGKSNEEQETTSNLLSANYDAIGVDQMEDPEITMKDFEDLMGRLRGQTGYMGSDSTMPSTGPRWFCFTANPTMGWLYKKVVRPFLRYKATGERTDELILGADGMPLMAMYEGSTMTNAHNLPADFVAGLQSTMKGQRYERFVLGKWVAYEGLIYDAYDNDVHGIAYDDIVDHIVDCIDRHVKVQVIEAYDFGLTSPSCYGLFVVDDWGRVFLLDGYHKSDFPYDLQPPEIQRIRNRYSHMLDFTQAIRADPSIFKKSVVAKHKNTGSTVRELLTTDKIKFKPASNDVQSGLAKVGSYINFHPKMMHPITKDFNAPLFYHSKELAWFEDEITGYMWKKNPSGEKTDEPNAVNDHAMDMCKYGLCHLPDPSEIQIPTEMKRPKWMQWMEEDAA